MSTIAHQDLLTRMKVLHKTCHLYFCTYFYAFEIVWNAFISYWIGWVYRSQKSYLEVSRYVYRCATIKLRSMDDPLLKILNLILVFGDLSGFNDSPCVSQNKCQYSEEKTIAFIIPLKYTACGYVNYERFWISLFIKIDFTRYRNHYRRWVHDGLLYNAPKQIFINLVLLYSSYWEILRKTSNIVAHRYSYLGNF